MLGKHYLCAVVTQEESNGQAAPVSSNTLGSRQGLSVDWRTPQAQEAGAKVDDAVRPRMEPQRCLGNERTQDAQRNLVLQSQTINQQVEMVQRQELWLTPRANGQAELPGEQQFAWEPPRSCGQRSQRTRQTWRATARTDTRGLIWRVR
jgi:hypothetical protein